MRPICLTLSVRTTRRRAITFVLGGALCLAPLVVVSAHVVKGLAAPTLATAFVSSPSAGGDAPIRLTWGATDTRLSVACFNVANTSPSRADRPDWPRVTGVGFELPGTLSGFSLVEPVDEAWELIEDVRTVLPDHGTVTLDFALVAHLNPRRWKSGRHIGPLGIPPGQPGVRGSGTRFCVSGPFPDELIPGQQTMIEQLLNGVVVGFIGVDGTRRGVDAGVWDNAARVIPLYLE